MSPLERLKAEAVALQARKRALGRPTKHCAALEEVAKNHGYENWRACCASLGQAPADSASPPETTATDSTALQRYVSSEWRFALDIPTRWNAFPPVSANSPFEVVRFMSHEDGIHLLIVFRAPRDPKKTPKAHSDSVQPILTQGGFGNFVDGETTIRSRPVPTLDFDKPQGDGTWSCRHYFVNAGTLGYTLGFGTDRRAAMIDLYDRMAKSFEML